MTDTAETMTSKVGAAIVAALEGFGEADIIAGLGTLEGFGGVDVSAVLGRAAIAAMAEPTEAMIHAGLKVDLPATYRDYLRHPANGVETAKQNEARIAHEQRRWSAQIQAALAEKPE
jgi:hypothetical protein